MPEAASPKRRLSAALLDGFLGLFVSCAGLAAGVRISPAALDWGASGGSVQSFSLGVGLAVLTIIVTFYSSLLLFSLTEVFWSASPGKALLGLRIRRLDGACSSLLQRAMRYCVKQAYIPLLLVASRVGNDTGAAVLGLLGVASLAGYLMILGPRRAALHDRIASTAVVSR